MMNKIKQYIQKREFLKFFLMFFSGTLLAQIITMAVSPILTRIYTPEDFGVYAIYLSIVTLLIVFVTGRYEYAINSTKKEKDAISLYKIVNYLSFFFSGLLLSIVFMFGEKLINIFSLSITKTQLYFVPFTLLMMGLLQSTTYYLNRQKKFKELSKSKIMQSTTNASSSLLMGVMNFGAVGLIIANILSVFVAQLYQKIKVIFKTESKFDIQRIKVNIKKYKQYPLYNAPSAFFDNLAIQSPVFILVYFFSETIVGFYSLTTRIIGLPLSLISTSISQVFLSQVSELHRENKPYKHVIIKVAKYLGLIGLIPITIMMIFGPQLFGIVFGEQWKIAGEYAQILSVGYYFKFIVSPLSMVFFINQRVKLLSIIQTIRAFSTIIVLVFTSIQLEIKSVLLVYTLHEVFFYIIYFYFIVKTSNKY